MRNSNIIGREMSDGYCICSERITAIILGFAFIKFKIHTMKMKANVKNGE